MDDGNHDNVLFGRILLHPSLPLSLSGKLFSFYISQSCCLLSTFHEIMLSPHKQTDLQALLQLYGCFPLYLLAPGGTVQSATGRTVIFLCSNLLTSLYCWKG